MGDQKMLFTTRLSKSPSQRQQSPWRQLVRTFADWQLTTGLSITTLIVALNFSFPDLSDPSTLSTYQTRIPTIQFENPLPKFIYLSYKNPVTGKYFKGNDDIYFVAFWILVWLSLREILLKFFWKPIGSKMGLSNPNKLQRFTEQGWTLIYCSVFWCMGIKILSEFPEPVLSLNIRQYWQGYPHDSLSTCTKFYYLSQTAFWFQQLIVLHLEKRRKDYHQMFAHHVVTATLICASYATNWTGLGVAVHTTMDLSDIILSLAKMFTYLKIRLAGDASFMLFVFSWFYTRHYVFIQIILAIYYDLPQDIEFVWKPSEGHLACHSLWYIFLTLLVALQMLLILWLFMILKVLWRVARGQVAQDTRSDSEDSDEEDIEERVESLKNISSEKEPLLKGSP